MLKIYSGGQWRVAQLLTAYVQDGAFLVSKGDTYGTSIYQGGQWKKFKDPIIAAYNGGVSYSRAGGGDLMLQITPDGYLRGFIGGVEIAPINAPWLSTPRAEYKELGYYVKVADSGIALAPNSGPLNTWVSLASASVTVGRAGAESYSSLGMTLKFSTTQDDSAPAKYITMQNY